MDKIEAVLLEPVGCLAEFASEPFHEAAVRLFGRKGKASKSGSRSYWHLLNLIEDAPLGAAQRALVESLELDAVDRASIYDDVVPALMQLREMDLAVSIATSLSAAATARFLERCAVTFAAVWHRDNSGGIKAAPLRRAASSPEHTIYLADTAEGLKTARAAGVHPVLMMNDPDESKRLALHNPGQNPLGGVVSLHELPDFVRLVRVTSAKRSP